MTVKEALNIMESTFVESSAEQAAEVVADALMTDNQKALMAQFDGRPFRERLFLRARYRQAILRKAIAEGA